jgi:hypothetical protein
MNRALPFLLALLASSPLAAAAAPPRTLRLAGPATNTTAEITATMHLTLVIDGERLTAQLQTDAPLTGSGKLAGRIAGGWCELEGKLAEGFEVKFRGVLNERDFRGIYLAAPGGQPLQYGKFILTVQPAPAPPAPPVQPAPKKK